MINGSDYRSNHLDVSPLGKTERADSLDTLVDDLYRFQKHTCETFVMATANQRCINRTSMILDFPVSRDPNLGSFPP